MTYDYITPILTGFCVGIGSVTATWFTQRYIIKRMEKIEKQADNRIKKLKKLIKNGKNKIKEN